MNIGIIGCGGIAAVHARSIENTDKNRLAAVADCVYDKAQKMAQAYGARAYEDWETMINQEALDVVHLCTPHYLHTDMAVSCLKHGIHVFTEKPPVISRAQLEQLQRAYIKAKDAEGLRLCVCFQNRWNPDVQFVKNTLLKKELGNITGIRGIVSWCRGTGYYSDQWHGKKALEGGGALINQGIHTLDLMQYFVDEAAIRTEAVLDNLHLKGQIEVEDTLCAYIRYPDLTANLYVTTGYTSDMSPLIDICCENGHIRLENGEVIIRRGQDKPELHTFESEELYGKSYWGAGHQKAISHFYRSIAEGTGNLLDFENVSETVDLMLRIYEAAEPKT